VHNKFFTSDTHFFHANILKFLNDDGTRLRHEFGSVEEMHEVMIERWNAVVKQADKVYHLGDVTFRYDKPFRELMHRLNGKKGLLLGNHDRIKGTCLLDYFEKLELWKGFHEHDFTCSHIPLRLDSLRDGRFNVHGHTHRRTLDDPHYINVSVEPRNYTPVALETILAEIKAVA
jgi:calcineurin-like phosphoesterase family protein